MNRIGRASKHGDIEGDAKLLWSWLKKHNSLPQTTDPDMRDDPRVFQVSVGPTKGVLSGKEFDAISILMKGLKRLDIEVPNYD